MNPLRVLGGAPVTIWLAVDFQPTNKRLDLTIYLWDKTPPTRLPESHWLSFSPKTEGGGWLMSKLEELISPNDIILVNLSIHGSRSI